MSALLRPALPTVLTVAALAMLSVKPASAVVTYTVTVDTSSVAGTMGFLDFQFNPGNSTSQLAVAQITNFNPDGGTLTGAPMINGNVTGTLPGTVTFVNSTALNEYFQGFTYGTKVSFVLMLSGPAIDSPNGMATAGSTFGLGLYDMSQNPILTNQGGTTGFAGEVNINLDGTTTPIGFPTATAGPSVVTFGTVPADAFQVRYASNLNIGDSYISISDTGASVTATGVTGFTGGNLCVNVYVFDEAEELLGCCSCFVTPNGLVSASVKGSLISNNLTPEIPNSVVIKLLATSGATAATCNASSPTLLTLTPGLVAWGTTLHAAPGAPVKYAVTETPFYSAVLSVGELNHLTSFCGFIQSNASGFGICNGCSVGGLGATSLR